MQVNDEPWVPVNDLARGARAEAATLQRVMSRVVDSGWFVLGPEGKRFEAELGEYLGVEHVVGVASGTDALELALRAVMPADRSVVLTVANAGGYATTAALRAGFQVRYIDVCEESHLLDAALLEEALSPEVGVVVVTHLYGRAADLAPVLAACRQVGVAVVEDCAQSIGAVRDGVMAGSSADAAAFSFYPTKNLGALGDGGAVATSDPATAERVRRLRQYGWTEKYTVGLPGGCNSRLDELQAAVLTSRLTSLDKSNERRREIVNHYRERASRRVRVLLAPDRGHVAHLGVLVTDHRSELVEHLHAARIHTDVHYPVPDHHQPAWRENEPGLLPVTERLATQVLSVPVFPELTNDEIERVGAALECF